MAVIDSAPATVRRPNLLSLGDRVRTPEPIGAVPAGTTGRVIEVRSIRFECGNIIQLADYREYRYTISWDLVPAQYTSDLAAPTLEVGLGILPSPKPLAEARVNTGQVVVRRPERSLVLDL